ncbi:MAG TPA: hypothetical protein VGJ28_26925 [Micromonosporaceae bacterium]
MDENRSEPPLTVDGSLAVIDAERSRVERRVHFNPSILWAIWAVAWFIGFGCAYLAYGPKRVIPAWTGPTVAAILLASAFVASIAYAMRIDRGISGPSRTSAAMYGWTWTLGFVCLSATNILLGRDLNEKSTVLLWSASTLLLAGVLQLAGAALYRDRMQYATGVWTMLCATGAVTAGVPGNFLVQAIAGGGGFALMAAYFALRSSRSDRLRRRSA